MHAKGKLLSAEEKLETGRFERNRRTGDIPGARGMKKSTLWLWAVKDNVWDKGNVWLEELQVLRGQ